MCAPIHSLIRPFSHQTALVSLPSPVASWTILRAERVQHNPILNKLTVSKGCGGGESGVGVGAQRMDDDSTERLGTLLRGGGF